MFVDIETDVKINPGVTKYLFLYIEDKEEVQFEVKWEGGKL
jgi:hypothetical protein